MTCNSYNSFFETIANKTRLKIINALLIKDMSVTEICTLLNEEQSKISHNLKCLSDCNFIEVKKDGKLRIYTLNKDTIKPLMNIVQEHIKKHCCKKCKLNTNHSNDNNNNDNNNKITQVN